MDCKSNGAGTQSCTLPNTSKTQNNVNKKPGIQTTRVVATPKVSIKPVIKLQNGRLNGSLKVGDNTVIFDAKVTQTGNTINLSEIGIYEVNNFGTKAAQNTIGTGI